MATWYEVPNRYGWHIRPLEVTKFTNQSVWVGKHRRARSSYDDEIVPTLEEARTLLRDRCERTIKALRYQLEEAEAALKSLKA
jgi:hypothetical protein